LPTGATAITQANGTNTTALATTAFVNAEITYKSTAATAPANPTGTSAVSPGVMCGLAATITPRVTGRILVTFNGTFGTSVAGSNGNIQPRYGTGAAPANGAVGTTGTAIGPQSWVTGTPNASFNVPYSMSWLLTGLTLGTAYWFDMQQWVGGVAGTINLYSNAVCLVEV